MFWFKKKKVVVDAFTNQPGVGEYFPIQKSSKFLPDWWKELPKSNTYSTAGIEYERSTMKRCIGFIDLYKKSFTIPMFTELKIKMKDGEWICISSAGLADDKGQIEVVTSHDREQFGSEFDDYSHFKILMPWILQEKEGVNFMLTGAYWNQTKLWANTFVSPGIVNFKYQNGINISFFKPKINGIQTFLPNEPIAHLIPLTDREVEIKTHIISNEEYQKKLSLSTYSSKFTDRYRFNKKIIDEREQKKCPFGFGK